jgi:hypothetical protein
MRDYYQDGFDLGYGKNHSGSRSYPTTDGDDYSYRQGVEDGRDRRNIANEIDREYEQYGY